VSAETVSAFTRPYDYYYDRYQLYYREGLRRECAERDVCFEAVPMTRLPRVLRPVRRARDRVLIRLPGDRATRLLDRAARRVEGPIQAPGPAFHSSIGQYVVRGTNGAACRVCLDASDFPSLGSPELVAWSDLYFKANLWPRIEYPDKVLPLINGDPLILDKLPTLRSFRSTRKEIDVCFIVRVWGGRDEVEGIEHNLRLLEAVNRAQCSKVVIAYLVAGDIGKSERRLRSVGVTCTTRPIRPATLWRLMGKSRLNVIRLGMHHCIPWRMAGTLGMGACVVLDQPPASAWPEPLREDVNFLSLGARTIDAPTAEDARYEEIPDKIEEWLGHGGALDRMRSDNARYFDRFVEPQRVGASILGAVERQLAGEGPPSR
jgi:hypothetical protein